MGFALPTTPNTIHEIAARWKRPILFATVEHTKILNTSVEVGSISTCVLTAVLGGVSP